VELVVAGEQRALMAMDFGVAVLADLVLHEKPRENSREAVLGTVLARAVEHLPRRRPVRPAERDPRAYVTRSRTRGRVEQRPTTPHANHLPSLVSRLPL